MMVKKGEKEGGQKASAKGVEAKRMRVIPPLPYVRHIRTHTYVRIAHVGDC